MNMQGGPSVLPPQPAPCYSNVKVLLASNSPRRRELLGMIMPEFGVAASRNIDETYPSTLAAEDVPAYLSKLKASAYASDLEANELIITADTVVICDGHIMGKPKDCDDAVAMLRTLAGRTHMVVTGVTLSSLSGRKSDTFSVSTEVTFGPLQDEEISAYVERFRPLDKAGAYGIQEWIGAAAITGIKGSFYNVMGLPLNALCNHLRDFFV